MKIYVITAGLLMLHSLEEILHSFWRTDYFSQSLASALNTEPFVVYVAGQLVLYSLVAAVLYQKSTRIGLLNATLGLVLLFEATHVFSAVAQRTYTVGLLTGILLLMVAVPFWAMLIKNQKRI